MNILDSRFYAVVDRLSNLFILNLFWIISCLPIVTIAPATSAMYSVVRQWKLNQDTSVVRNYFRYFKENFKQSFLIGIIWMLLAVLLYFNYFYLNQDQSGLKFLMIIPLIIISVVFLIISTFLFPVMTHYNATWKGAIKNSFLLAIVNFPSTILILGFLALLTVIIIYVPATSLIIFSVGAYINFSLCNRVFHKNEQFAINNNKIMEIN
ncbi:DUF624 domain-containing protein [Bacillus sp. ISL-40]|uniref:YesL family protein n=1 Tax=unclassified Bacillus (in: firmicutes) TaxID=185979 RepID=UPI001BE89E8B|nr:MULTISPECIES: DUF624 domain-containing protein [unclassified Bacillus (in: firmicutes)]MBT2700512.1 DUF624 domain-containing protein [Bacillus sp. ISL-40]MBT2742780.1 DUF624 domain-containing protein [Bacillus sp. ISL-77]